MQFATQTEKINQKCWSLWSFLDPKKDLLLFDNFGFAGFKKIVIDNDLSVIDELLFSLQKFNKKDSKINLVSLTFSTESTKK